MPRTRKNSKEENSCRIYVKAFKSEYKTNQKKGRLINSILKSINFPDLVIQCLLWFLIFNFFFQRHKWYVYRYWFCECLCLVNIVVQLILMDKFFDGDFLKYGLNVMNLADTPQEKRFDPMVYVFPRVTKCIFHKYGASGSIQKHDAMCILPLNIVNEKTYIFIWFWYIILSVMLIALIIYR